MQKVKAEPIDQITTNSGPSLFLRHRHDAGIFFSKRKYFFSENLYDYGHFSIFTHTIKKVI